MGWIQERRTELGYTRKSFAEVAHVALATVRSWEDYSVPPTEAALPRLAKALRIDEDVIRRKVGVKHPTTRNGGNEKSYLAQRRRSVGLTQLEVGRLIGVTYSAVSYYEAGRQRVPNQVVSRYACILRVPEHEFRENVSIRPPYGEQVPLPPKPNDKLEKLPLGVVRVGTCADHCRCPRFQCVWCKQFWTGDANSHICENPSQ